MYKKIFLSILIASFSLSCLPVFSQETEVTAEDLDVSDGRFSWLTDVVRNIQILITRDPIKKSELELEKASRQLIKARKRVQENPDDQKLQERLEKYDDRYQELIRRINNRIEAFKEENPDSIELRNFLDKYTDHQLKHQEILSRLEEQVPRRVMETIRERREEHLMNFGEVMNRLQNREELQERLENALEGSQERVERKVRQVKIIEELEEKAVPAIKQTIREMRQERKELFNSAKDR